MAEQVQALMERMVAPLRDLRDRGIFTEEEIHQIVTRRRSSEYLLQKLSVSRSDYLRYIEQEILLEKLRKLRKQKVLQEWREKLRRGDVSDSEDEDSASNNRKHAYQTSGPGDAHIVSNIHFIYQRLLKKFHYPIDVILNYAEFAKEQKSFSVMSRVYAEGLQRHPREEGLWIQAASFEFFGYIARDDDKNESTKLVGSSIQNARVLMQRGLRINGKSSQELWLQYFALELHYVVKLMGRKEILEGGTPTGCNDDGLTSNTMLLPCRIIYKNAIKSIPNSLSFRLRFVETSRMFPRTVGLEQHIIESIERDFGDSPEAWVSRISFAEEQMKKDAKIIREGNSGGGLEQGFLAMPADGGNEEDEVGHTSKKRRLAVNDPALGLVNEALEAVPTAKMYLECTRYLQMRIQRLLALQEVQDDNDGEQSDSASYLIRESEDAESAVNRHSNILKELYSRAEANGVYSSNLVLNQADYLSSNGKFEEADKLLGQTIEKGDVNAHLFIRWANLSREMAENGMTPNLSPVVILRKGLKVTEIHKRDAFLLLSTELMKYLMSRPRSTKVTKELNSLFQQLLLVSQGLPKPNTSNSDSYTNEDEENVNLAEIFLTYLEYTIPESSCSLSDNEAVRSIYNRVIFHSNFADFDNRISRDELSAMKSFFDICLHFETSVAATPDGMDKKNAKRRKKQLLSKLYERAIAFFGCGCSDSILRKVLDGYQRKFDDMKFGL